MTYEPHSENEATVSDRMNRLLFAWAISYSIGGNRRAISVMTGQITKSPGAQLMRDAVEQCVEIDINERVSYHTIYSDECLLYVNQIVNALPDKLRKVIDARFKWYEGRSTKDKAKRLHINKSTYYRRLDRAMTALDNAMDWRLAR